MYTSWTKYCLRFNHTPRYNNNHWKSLSFNLPFLSLKGIIITVRTVILSIQKKLRHTDVKKLAECHRAKIYEGRITSETFDPTAWAVDQLSYNIRSFLSCNWKISLNMNHWLQKLKNFLKSFVNLCLQHYVYSSLWSARDLANISSQGALDITAFTFRRPQKLPKEPVCVCV